MTRCEFHGKGRRTRRSGFNDIFTKCIIYTVHWLYTANCYLYLMRLITQIRQDFLRPSKPGLSIRCRNDNCPTMYQLHRFDTRPIYFGKKLVILFRFDSRASDISIVRSDHYTIATSTLHVIKWKKL